MSKPHIIYILSDEHSGVATGHAGDPNLQTPNIDRMASEGVGFVNAYANCPVCTPSRGTIFSGRYAHSGPVQGFYDVYKATAPSIATMLRDVGYHTAYFGKWHCGTIRDQNPPDVTAEPDYYNPEWSQRTPEFHRAGFQDWFGCEMNNAPNKAFYYDGEALNPTKLDGYQTDALTNLVIDYIRQYDREEPLFLVLSVEPPHWPLEAPEAFMRFDPETLQVRPNFGDKEGLRERLATYYAMIENLDWNIGRLLDSIENQVDFKDTTMTVYFSDHGDFMGSHNQIEDKGHPHEESTRIPAVFHCPGRIPAQGNRTELFSLVDMVPTTLGFAGVDLPEYLQGMDFSPALRRDPFKGPEHILLEMVGNPHVHFDYVDWRGLVSDRWKYAFYETGHEVLFNLQEDPFEQHNLAKNNPEACEKMRQLLLGMLSEAREPYFDILIKHGVTPDGPALNSSTRRRDGIAPYWDDLIENV